MAKSLNLDDFKLFQAACDFRYDDAYNLWDKSGLIWSSIKKESSDLKPEKVEPNNTTFIVNNKYQISIKIDRTSVIDLKPSSSLNEFMDITPKIYNKIIEILKIDTFNRIGFRLIYVQKFPDKASASNAFKEANLINLPRGKNFNIDGKVFLPRCAYNWDDDSASVRILIEVRDRKIDFDVHPSIEEISSLHLTKYELVYDIDYYISGILSVGQLDIKEWISQAYHIIKRDSKNILGGI